MHLRRPCRPPSTPCHRLKASPSNDTPCSPVERRLRGGQTSTPLPPPLLHKEMDLPRYLRRVNLLPVILTLLSFPSPRPIRKKNYTTCNDRLVFYSQNSLQEKFSNVSKSDIHRIKYNISIPARRETETRSIDSSSIPLYSILFEISSRHLASTIHNTIGSPWIKSYSWKSSYKQRSNNYAIRFRSSNFSKQISRLSA